MNGNNNSKNKLHIFRITGKILTISPKEDKSDEDECQKSRKQWIISALTSLILGVIIAFDYKTVEYMRELVNISKEIFLSFLAIIIGAFALYQALLSGKVISILYNQEAIFKELNESWLGTIMLFLFGVIFNYILICFLIIIPNNFLILNNYMLSSSIAMILIVAYFTLTIRIFIEVGNFVINLYNMFQIYNKVKLLEEINKDKNNDDD